MYYAKELFVKRGPLATLWLAGHVMRKVHKQQVVAADIEKMCEIVERPPVSLALPTQSTLLRGVVRIEQKKSIYLLEDAERATGRSVEQPARERTTAPINKIKASKDAITFTDKDASMLQAEELPSLEELDTSLLVDQTTGQELLFAEEEMKRPEEMPSQPEGVALTQSFEELSELEFGSFGDIDQQMEMGDGFAELALDQGAEVPPSPALSAAGVPLMDLDQLTELPKKAKKLKKAYAPVIDDVIELTDAELRAQLGDASDIVVQRPIPPPQFRAEFSVADALQRPAAADPIDNPSIAENVVDMMQRLCRIVPVVDEMGHTAEEAEIELGGGAAWELEEGESEARAQEMDITREDLDVSRYREAEQAVEAEGVLFGLTGPEEVSGVERRRREVSGRGVEVVSELETPELGVPESQFEVAVEEARAKKPRITIERRTVNKHTEIFRNELQKKFSRLVRAKQEPIVELDEFLSELVHGDPGRRDRALAFYQTLVLTSLDVTRVQQEAPFADILITKGDKFNVSFSSSQMFSDTPTQ